MNADSESPPPELLMAAGAIVTAVIGIPVILTQMDLPIWSLAIAFAFIALDLSAAFWVWRKRTARNIG